MPEKLLTGYKTVQTSNETMPRFRQAQTRKLYIFIRALYHTPHVPGALHWKWKHKIITFQTWGFANKHITPSPAGSRFKPTCVDRFIEGIAFPFPVCVCVCVFCSVCLRANVSYLTRLFARNEKGTYPLSHRLTNKLYIHTHIQRMNFLLLLKQLLCTYTMIFYAGRDDLVTQCLFCKHK